MIKKIFIGGIITTFTIITNLFVSAYTCNSSKSYCYDFEFGEYDNSNGFKGSVIDNNLNFYGLSFDYYIGDNRFLSIWWEDENSIFTGYYSTSKNTNGLGFENIMRCPRYWICNSRPPEGSSLSDYCTENFNFSQLSSLIKDHDRYLFNCSHFGDNYLQCSVCSYNSEGGNYVCLDSGNGCSWTNESFASKDYINERATLNPYSSNVYEGTGGNFIGGIELNSTGSAINYFENYYGWDEKICYVGIDNVTDLWGSSVSFEEGSGLDIFDTFELLYGNTELTKMYVWMNAWLINYNQWFQDSEDRLYLAYYNSGTNQVNLYYDNLTFPFANQPVALYFMADNISNYTDRQTMASDVVSYCYLKLKGGTFDDIIDNSTKQSVNQYTEKYNTNKGYNSDGTVKHIDYSNFGNFAGESPFSGDLSVKNSLKNFFDKIHNQISGINISTTYHILPSWIVSALLIVVLFKIIRRK